VNAETIYKIWHRETFKAKGTHVKEVKNFDKAKAKPSWEYFENFVHFMERNNGALDLNLYMEALAEHYGGYFNPSLLGSQRSIKIYKEYVSQKTLDVENDEADMTLEILKSIKFVVGFCRERGLVSLEEYISHDMYLIPSLLKHYNAGSISPFFLACIDNFNIILTNFAQDAVNEYISDFEDWYYRYRIKVRGNEKCKRISDNLEIIVEKYLKKYK
jgi:hypothetical protein